MTEAVSCPTFGPSAASAPADILDLPAAAGAVTRTSASSGVQRDVPAPRAEFFASFDS